MIKKGSIVKFYATVDGLRVRQNGFDKRILHRVIHYPKKGIVLGYSFIRTGRLDGGNNDPYDYEAPHLEGITDNKVLVIEPLDGERYLKPVKCLEDDTIELIGRQS